MSKMSKSPDRNTFQKEGYILRCKQEGKEPDSDYLAMYEKLDQLDLENEINPEWQKNNMEYDMRNAGWFVLKVRASETYAQNLYAAMCNMQFQKTEIFPILKEERWSCSWRTSGGVVADLREEGDYINWYCSGIGSGLGNGDDDGTKGFVSEGTVTEEIRQDLRKLGWIPVPYND